MDQVLNSLKCANCRNILLEPVVLPCGDTICKSHIIEVQADEHIICSQCGSRHSIKEGGEFVVIKALANMIQAQLSSLNFGPHHNESVKSCETLREQLNKVDLILNELDFFIHESIDEMKKKVELKSEQLKLRIDEISQTLLDDLNTYEKECKEKRAKKSRLSCFNRRICETKRSGQTEL